MIDFFYHCQRCGADEALKNKFDRAVIRIESSMKNDHAQSKSIGANPSFFPRG
jgi:hypothetical protein